MDFGGYKTVGDKNSMELNAVCNGKEGALYRSEM